MRRIIYLTLIMGALVFMALAAAGTAETWLYAVNVGKGDALIVRLGAQTYLIDTGKGYACGRLRRALYELQIEKLDGVFITHVDSDHIEGLAYLAASGIPVENWYASPYFFEYDAGEHPLEELGADVTWLEAGDVVELDDGGFRVLAPLSMSTEDENDNSLVMMLETADGRILLTGDMEFAEEAELLSSGAQLACDVLKIANHGDDYATGREFAMRAAARVAVISTDPYEKKGTPAPEVLANLEAAGTQAFVTYDHSAVWVRLEAGDVEAGYLDWESAPNYGVSMHIERDEELFTITNTSDARVDMENWYIYSDKGNELFIFPALTLEPGKSVVVGSKSAPEGRYELYWDEKNVISNKDVDIITLYDPDGNAIVVN